MGCLLAAAPGPHPGLAGSSGRIAERSLLWGFSGMEIPNINFVWLNCTFPRLYRPLFDLAQLGNHPKQGLPTTFHIWKVTHL